jgi:hypothetical protein
MTNYSLANISVQQLRRALAIREEIEKLQAELVQLSGAPAPAATGTVLKRRGAISAAGRAKVAAAQRARWAKIKALKAGQAAVVAVKAKRGVMSAAGRARIIAAQKARWAKFRAAKKPAVAAGAPAKAKKGKLSAAGRARIVAAQKARWAEVKAAKAAKTSKAG